MIILRKKERIMKKVLSRLLSISLAIMVAVGLMVVPATAPVHADGSIAGSIKYAKSMTLYSRSDYEDVYEIIMEKKVKNAKSVKITSSNKKFWNPLATIKEKGAS